MLFKLYRRPPATTIHRAAAAAAAASYDAERSLACRGPILSTHGPRHPHSLQQPPTARLLEVVTKATLLIIIITVGIWDSSGIVHTEQTGEI